MVTLNPISEGARSTTPLFTAGADGRALSHFSLTNAVRRAVTAAGEGAGARRY